MDKLTELTEARKHAADRQEYDRLTQEIDELQRQNAFEENQQQLAAEKAEAEALASAQAEAEAEHQAKVDLLAELRAEALSTDGKLATVTGSFIKLIYRRIELDPQIINLESELGVEHMPQKLVGGALPKFPGSGSRGNIDQDQLAAMWLRRCAASIEQFGKVDKVWISENSFAPFGVIELGDKPRIF